MPTSFVSVLDRAISVRKRHLGWWHNQSDKNKDTDKENEQANETHGYFIVVLDKVRDILQPRMPTERPKSPSSAPSGGALTSEDSATGQSANLFESLNVEEPSDAFLNFEPSPLDRKPFSTPQVQYGVKQAPDSLEEVYFAVECLLEDFFNIRQYLRQVWDGYRQRRVDLIAASITTNTAIDFARYLHEDFNQTFPNHTNFEEHINFIFSMRCVMKGQDPRVRERANDDMNFEVYGDAVQIFLPTCMILSGFKNAIRPGILPRYNPDSFGVYNSSTNRASKSSRDKFVEDKVLLLDILPEFCVFSQLPEGIPAEDEMARGMRRLYNDKDLPVWLIFAAQVFLDINHALRQQVSIGYDDLVKSAKYVENNIHQVLKFHENLRVDTWPVSNDQCLHQILERITRWVKTDAVQEARTSMARRSGAKIPSSKSFFLFQHHPLYCGLLSYSIKALAQEASIVFVNAWGSVLYTAHLYNALRQEKLLSNTWPDMDLVLLMHRTQDMFIGDFPKTVEDYAKRFSLAMGYSATMLAKNGRGSGVKASKAGPRCLNELSPISRMFMARYCRNEGRTNLSPDDIDIILNKSTNGDATDEEDNIESERTTLKGKINVSGEPSQASRTNSARSRNSRNRRESTPKTAETGVRPTQLLEALLNAMQGEMKELNYNHFRLHTSSWLLLRSIKEAVSDDLRDIYGPGYIEKENQLPFIVGYVFFTAVQTKKLGGRLLPKKKDVVTSRILIRTAAVMKQMLDAGLGAIEVRMLKKLMGMEIEVPDLLELSG